MGLYDNYKQDNSSYIPQFAGTIVPELKEFSTTLQNRYNAAKDTDDLLVEAMGNLQHLGTAEDTTYANELKQKYMNGVLERSEREDYENMGRRTARDAKQFSADYNPLAVRMKGMQDIQERVLQDKDIFDPATKDKILARITKTNAAKRDPATGDFQRDASGKIILGGIQDWAYAKDVDINAKLADFLSKKESDISQSGFRADGSGLMVSGKHETRTTAEMAQLAKEMMETDPEIKAMVERDVELNTFNYSPEQMTQVANAYNVSVYEQLKKSGASDSAANIYLKAHGISKETASEKPVDALRKRFAAAGKNPAEADSAFVKEQVRKDLMSPHIDLVAKLLKIDRNTIEAREDPKYAARAMASAMGAILADKDKGESIPIVTQGSDIQELNMSKVTERVKANEGERAEVEHSLQAVLGNLSKTPPPGMNKSDIQHYYNKTSELLNDPIAQAKLMKSLGNSQAALDLQVTLNKYKAVSDKAMMDQSILGQVKNSMNTDALYKEYSRNRDAKRMTKSEFLKTMDEGPSGFVDQAKGIWGAITGNSENKVLNDFKGKYAAALQSQANVLVQGKSFVSAYTSLSPIAGKIDRQTTKLEEGLQQGTLGNATVVGTGQTLDEMLAEEYGTSGWLYDSKSDIADDLKDPKSKINMARKDLKARFNLETTSDGKMTATVTLNNGKVKTIALNDVPASYGNGIRNEFFANSATMMSRKEATHYMSTASIAAGSSTMTKMNVMQLRSLTPSAMVHPLNDIFGVKVIGAGSGVSATKLYQLLVLDKLTGKFVQTSIKPMEQYQALLGIIGEQELHTDFPSGPGNSNPTQ